MDGRCREPLSHRQSLIRYNKPLGSWPDLFRPSTWIPGSSPGMTVKKPEELGICPVNPSPSAVRCGLGTKLRYTPPSGQAAQSPGHMVFPGAVPVSEPCKLLSFAHVEMSGQ